MTDNTFIYLTVFLVFLFAGNAVSVEQCSFCMCDTWYGLDRASCTGRHLYSIHTDAPNNVQALDLSDNVIATLYNFELANAGLTKLKYLNLSTNAISDISLNAFDGLTDLTVLDLSRNRLQYVANYLFEKNKNLRILKLSKNNFNSHVPKLRQYWLTELYLDSCQINYLPTDTFNGLTHVRHLDLSNNLMIQMSYIIVQRLLFLNKLSLGRNPWSCNGVMYDLQTYLNHKNIEFDQICGRKTKLQKSEKMIVLNYPGLAIVNMSAKETKPVIVSDTSDKKNVSTCEQTENQMSIVTFLCIGFISGISSGLIVSYIWLSKMFSCNRRYRSRPDDVSQIQSLLNVYLQGSIDSDRSLIESRPSTPPPAYREVMLRPSLYRCPSIVSNLNNNDAGCRERYT